MNTYLVDIGDYWEEWSEKKLYDYWTETMDLHRCLSFELWIADLCKYDVIRFQQAI